VDVRRVMLWSYALDRRRIEDLGRREEVADRAL
jgi:hypothetical protein